MDMKETVKLNLENLKELLNTVVDGAFELGVAFTKSNVPLSKEEEIKNFQDKVWETALATMEELQEVKRWNWWKM